MLSSIAPLFAFALALAAAQNLVANGNFDEPGASQTQASPWNFNPSQTVSIALGEGRTGNAALLQCGVDDQPSQISQHVRTDGSTAYTLSFWAKTAETQLCSPSSDAGLDVGLLSGQLVHVDVSNIAADWKDFRFQVTGEDSGDQVVILGRGACFLIDDVSLTQGSAGSTSGSGTPNTSSCSSTSSSSSNSTTNDRRWLRFFANPNNCASSSAGSAGSGGGSDDTGTGSAGPRTGVPSVLSATALTLGRAVAYLVVGVYL